MGVNHKNEFGFQNRKVYMFYISVVHIIFVPLQISSDRDERHKRMTRMKGKLCSVVKTRQKAGALCTINAFTVILILAEAL